MAKHSEHPFVHATILQMYLKYVSRVAV